MVTKVYRAALSRARDEGLGERWERLSGAQVVAIPDSAVNGQCYDPPAYDTLRQPWRKMFVGSLEYPIGTLGIEIDAVEARSHLPGSIESGNELLVGLVHRVSFVYALYTFVGHDPAQLIASTFVGVDSHLRPDPVFISAGISPWVDTDNGKGYVVNAGIGYWSFGVSLLNCSNIETVDRTMPRPRRSDGRPRPPIEWKDVVVRTGARSTRPISRADGSDHVRLHAVRGHFKTFDERSLFGKLKGRYWWEQHVRGDVAKGVVAHKTYRLPGGARP